MSVKDYIQYWNVPAADRSRTLECDKHVGSQHLTFLRAVQIDASPAVVYRWVCQLSLAPYSYDWIDNLGRRSPQHLVPGADDVKLGQRMLTGPVVDIVAGEQLTVVGSRRANRIFGEHSMTYQVVGRDDGTTTLFGGIAVSTPSVLHRARAWALGAGDRVMMRRQLLNLKQLAESTASAQP